MTWEQGGGWKRCQESRSWTSNSSDPSEGPRSARRPRTAAGGFGCHDPRGGRCLGEARMLLGQPARSRAPGVSRAGAEHPLWSFPESQAQPHSLLHFSVVLWPSKCPGASVCGSAREVVPRPARPGADHPCLVLFRVTNLCAHPVPGQLCLTVHLSSGLPQGRGPRLLSPPRSTLLLRSSVPLGCWCVALAGTAATFP